ncbi:MAG: cation:proton antiporter [Prevotella sp.]|jgi:Kef-type K+ transport system membrane component KefB|nr:cation:proton antiporter [Prevotella sp.]
MNFLEDIGFKLPFTDPIIIFTLILFIILCAPILLNKLRIPHLIGLIIAGAIIGNNGLNLILKDSSFDLFGTVGLLYIMFIAGLEMDLHEFKKNSEKSLIFGLLTFAIPLALGTVAGYYILGFPLISSVLLATMFASHTLISYPIVSRLGVAKNPAVNITVGGTIITDTLALLVLSAISKIITGAEINHEFWVRILIPFAIFVALVSLLLPVAGRWFFKRVGDNVLQYVFVLSMVFLSALLAIYSGVEGIIGAFFAGLALNRLIPKTSPLMNRIEFVGNVLFIPFFLISVGMMIDFRVLVGDSDSIWIAFIITTLALLGKYLAAFITQKLFKYSTNQFNLIFGLSSSRAAATLAIVTIGHQMGLLNEDVLNATILMILITCTVSSFITQKGAQKIARLELTETEETKKTEERILIPADDAELVVRLVNLSIALRSPNSASNLYALNVITNNREASSADDKKKAGKILEIASKTAAATDDYVNELLRYDNDVLNAVSSVTKEFKITDIILGFHKDENIPDTLHGNFTGGVLSECDTTTFIYKPYQPMATVKRHLAIIPPHAHAEIGFPFWISKIWNIGLNTKKKIVVYASPDTIKYIKLYQEKYPIDVEYHVFDDWNNFLMLLNEIHSNDCMSIVMSRPNKISYNPAMERIPSYLNKYFRSNNFVLIYPIQTVTALGADMDKLNPALDHSKFPIFRRTMRNILNK